MTDENKNIPIEEEGVNDNSTPETPSDNVVDNSVSNTADSGTPTPPEASTPVPPPSSAQPTNYNDDFEEDLGDRLERLGGEPAPVITPEEFARLQKAGQVHIDSRGRVRTARRSEAEAGVSLRKRRAWYAEVK